MDDAVEAQIRKFRKELAGGMVALVLLAVLARAGAPLYGYEIARRFGEAEHAGLALNQGALYPVLRQMAAAGLLESWVEPSESGPPRRYYRTTELGLQTLGRWRAIWADARDFVDGALSGREGGE